MVDGARVSKAAYVKAGVSVTSALIVSLLAYENGGKYMNTPQPVIENTRDSQWCAGITGVPAKAFYTDGECDELTSGHLFKDVRFLSSCLPMEKLPARIEFAARHMAYNTGPLTVCNSSMAKRWRIGDYSPASCAVILKYTFVAGKDCRLTGKRCPGIVTRRDYEHGTCTGAIDWRLQVWDYQR